jgi:CHAT domain-containing protein
VLAVCDGGSGQTISSGSSFSIASAFLFSGSKSCVYSEWKLDDQVGAILFNNYLNRLANGEQKDWALRNAKLDYLQSLGNEDGSNPVYWSGLQVMGDVSPLTFGNGLNLEWVIIIASMLIVSLLIFLRLKIKK